MDWVSVKTLTVTTINVCTLIFEKRFPLENLRGDFFMG